MIGMMRENLSMFVLFDAQMWTFTLLGKVLFILPSLAAILSANAIHGQMYVTHLHVYGAASAHRWHL